MKLIRTPGYVGMKVDVYKNLHRACMSVRSRERNDYGRVIAYASYLLLHNCQFVVNQRGRDKVIQDKRKNVHAFVRGELKTGYGNFLGAIGPNPLTATASEILAIPLDGWVEVTYNPYYTGSFYTKKLFVSCARMVLIKQNKVYAFSPS